MRKDTASFTLKNAGREAEILPWLREFDAPVLDPETGKRRIPWDFLPDVLDANRDLYDNNLWTKNPIMQTGNMDENYHFVTDGLDALLARYGYVRDGYRYHASDETNREAVIVCFCHLGVTCVALSHLLNMTPVQLWQGMFLAPTSVTIVGTEERKPGEVYFRCQTVGDVHHLLSAGEPVSYYGAFNDPFQF